VVSCPEKLIVYVSEIPKRIRKTQVRQCGADPFDSLQGPVAGSFECGDETQDTMQDRESSDYGTDCQFLKICTCHSISFG